MTSRPPRAPEGDSAAGLALAVSVYLFWGFLPFYMKALAAVSPLEVLAHRILWSLPIVAAFLWLRGEMGRALTALRRPQIWAMAALSAALVSVNWGIYIWAVGSGHALDAALGYYINPLFSVTLGAVFLHERLSRPQKAAVALAALAVALLAYEKGSLPLAALGLTLSWGFYAFLKRKWPIGASEGFFIEILVLCPFALAYVLWLGTQGTAAFGGNDAALNALLLGAGVVTAGPLLVYAHAAKRLRLSTIGILQYIAPTMIFLIALFAFDERLEGAARAAFPLIWAALVLYTGSLWLQRSGKAVKEG